MSRERRATGRKIGHAGPSSSDPEFRAISPFGKMPGFLDGDFAIADSTAIVT
ncbi:glutathione S-transferase N-terminal domain-containing protein [Sphingomonas elodea]|uniref:glutathione S-transferase N-terminal domain-containing protein n=1 Tax=Sphingomonas elodea TaxID=179878 RepID=UPI001110BA14|nr:glutathione S-transferase N-terminal domain-containing protein [Sphingomonas elodea]